MPGFKATQGQDSGPNFPVGFAIDSSLSYGDGGECYLYIYDKKDSLFYPYIVIEYDLNSDQF